MASVWATAMFLTYQRLLSHPCIHTDKTERAAQEWEWMCEFRGWLKALKMTLWLPSPWNHSLKWGLVLAPSCWTEIFQPAPTFQLRVSHATKQRKNYFHYMPTEGLADVCKVFYAELWNANKHILVLLKGLTALKLTEQEHLVFVSAFSWKEEPLL